jgi:hypothetical protein
MGSGVDLTGVPDTELASIIARAEDMADAFCNVPMTPQRHDFRGGTITDETHPFAQHQVRVFPRHRPVKEIISYQVYATNNVYIDIDPDDIFIEPRGGWTEIVALSMSPVGFWAATDLISLQNPVLKLDYTYGWEFEVVDEILATDNDGLYRSQNQFWIGDPTIKVDGTEVTTGFTVNSQEGTVNFDDPQIGASVTATYVHALPSNIPQAVAIIAASLINERGLIGKGLGNLAEIQVEEVRLRRDARRTGTLVVAEAVPDTARALLAPFRYVAVG